MFTFKVELYTSLMEMALKKQDEIKRIIADTIACQQQDLEEKAANYQFSG